MKLIRLNRSNTKKLLLVWIMTSFILNSTAVLAMQTCHEFITGQAEVSDKEMPCHSALRSNTVQVSMEMPQFHELTEHNHQDSAKCNSFSCGHCQALTQASLFNNLSINLPFPSGLNHSLGDDVKVSILTYGIDYPP